MLAVSTSNPWGGVQERDNSDYHTCRYFFHITESVKINDVVVQFYHWVKFCFLLFLGMVMYDNEFETKENENFKPRIKLNHNNDIP